ncbi:MAG: response regulator [Solirubrobacteraceae bacterium]
MPTQTPARAYPLGAPYEGIDMNAVTSDQDTNTNAMEADAFDRAAIRVLIADDHPLIVAGVRRTIEQSEDFEVVGDARSVPELMTLVDRRSPDVVLLDLRMPGAAGVEHIEEIRTRFPQVKVVVLSACDDRPSIDSALHAGANAYMLKTTTAVDIASVLRQVARGAVFHAPPAPPAGSPMASEPQKPILTDREQTILAAVGAGLTTAAISRELWVSEHTIKFHLTNIYRKIGVSNRAGAVRYALEHGLSAD